MEKFLSLTNNMENKPNELDVILSLIEKVKRNKESLKIATENMVEISEQYNTSVDNLLAELNKYF